MPRQLRLQFTGAVYHVMSRGDRCEAIYLEDADRHDFLRTLAEACRKTGWNVYAYCLMSNHFHLVMQTPNANLVDGMRWLLSSYRNYLTIKAIAELAHIETSQSANTKLHAWMNRKAEKSRVKTS